MAITDDRIRFGKALGRRIKAERKKQDMSRYRLAELSGVADQQLALYEHGKQVPRADVLQKVLRALGCEDLTQVSP